MKDMHTYNTFIPRPVFERVTLSLQRFYRQTSSNTYTWKKYINFTVDTVKHVPFRNISETLHGLQSHGRRQGSIKTTSEKKTINTAEI